jgi:hypothetical protein
MKIFLTILAFAAFALDACSPTITPEPPVTLVALAKSGNQKTSPGGLLHSTADTNKYDFALSCGCGFRFVVENYDTSAIHYDIINFKDTTSDHKIRASSKSGLASGTHPGYLMIATLQPLTTELLRDTLRDTVVVP